MSFASALSSLLSLTLVLLSEGPVIDEVDDAPAEGGGGVLLLAVDGFH